MTRKTAKKAKRSPKKADRRKRARSVHVINERTSPRDEAIARADLTSFFLREH